jgi:hypothetical protein
MKLSMTSGIAAPWAIYGIEASSWGKDALLQRFYGCAFPLDEHGHFATCCHVLPDDVGADELLVQHAFQDSHATPGGDLFVGKTQVKIYDSLCTQIAMD